jgi:cell wall-associated NlpC family hydrolase
MSPARADHAVVGLAVLDLRREPDHCSELRSQLLLGEVVRVLARTRDGEWWRVENRTDRYRGWARAWGLVPASAARARRWERAARHRVARPWVDVRARPASSTLVSPLFLNSYVIRGPRRGRHHAVELPDGRRGWVPTAALRAAVGPRPDLAGRVRGLLGIPYLWGGRTPVGFDCSGFTQQVLAEQGVPLPRDADQQFRACDGLAAGERPRIGDLAFFGRPGEPASHVGLALGGGYFVHARGCVRVSSVDERNVLCDNEIARQFMGFRRPRPGPRREGGPTRWRR